LPISEKEFTIKDQRSYNCNLYFLKELQKRNIEIKWDHKLESVGSEQTLIFKNNKVCKKLVLVKSKRKLLLLFEKIKIN
jgi:hypothetical protein